MFDIIYLMNMIKMEERLKTDITKYYDPPLKNIQAECTFSHCCWFGLSFRPSFINSSRLLVAQFKWDRVPVIRMQNAEFVLWLVKICKYRAEWGGGNEVALCGTALQLFAERSDRGTRGGRRDRPLWHCRWGNTPRAATIKSKKAERDAKITGGKSLAKGSFRETGVDVDGFLPTVDDRRRHRGRGMMPSIIGRCVPRFDFGRTSIIDCLCLCL